MAGRRAGFGLLVRGNIDRVLAPIDSVVIVSPSLLCFLLRCPFSFDESCGPDRRSIRPVASAPWQCLNRAPFTSTLSSCLPCFCCSLVFF